MSYLMFLDKDEMSCRDGNFKIYKPYELISAKAIFEEYDNQPEDDYKTTELNIKDFLSFASYIEDAVFVYVTIKDEDNVNRIIKYNFHDNSFQDIHFEKTYKQAIETIDFYKNKSLSQLSEIISESVNKINTLQTELSFEFEKINYAQEQINDILN